MADASPPPPADRPRSVIRKKKPGPAQADAPADGPAPARSVPQGPSAFEAAGPEPPVPDVAPDAREPANARGMELLTVALVWASCGLSLMAVLAAAVPSIQLYALALALLGLLSGLASLGTSIGLGTLRHLRASVTGGNRYDQMRGARALRGAAFLVQVLTAAAWALVVLRVLWSQGIGFDVDGPAVQRGAYVLVAAIGVAVGLGHLQSLHTPTVRDRSAPTWVVIGLGAGAAILFGLLAALALAGQEPSIGNVTWEEDDVAFLALAAFAALAMALRRSRGMPTTVTLLADAPAGGGLTINRSKAVLVPTILAFALMLVVFLLVLMFGIGIGDLFTTVGSSPLLLGALLFLVVALLGSLGLASLLSRSAEKDPPLYAKVADRKVKQIRLVVAVSGITAAVFAVLTLLCFIGPIDRDLGLHFACFTLLSALGPYGFYAAREAERIRKLEERFPDFLRDIASSHKGGLTLHQSVTIAARGEYGPLTPEVHKMADQLSWNVSFHEALERFGTRVETPLVQRAVNLILQADKSGGSTTDVLLAAARDAREIKNLENERRQTMSLYTIVVYITFFVYLAVAATLYGQFAPAIVESSQAVQASDLDSDDIGGGSLTLRDYQFFYFSGAIVQAVGDGLVAGLLGSGKATLGLRHGFLMVLATYVTFILLL